MMAAYGCVLVIGWVLAAPLLAGDQSTGASPDRAYLTWTRDYAQQVGRSTRVAGRVAGGQGVILHTDRAYSYKLRATWMTPDVIRASARLIQLADRLTDDQTEV